VKKWAGVIVLCGGIAAARLWPSVSAAVPAAVSAREVLFTYQARLGQLPQQAGTIDVWVPLAKTTREQEIVHRQIHASVPYAIAQDPEYGNDILHLSLRPPLPEVLEVSVDYHARLGPGEEATADPTPSADEVARELTPRGLVIVDDEVRARAARAIAGRVAPVEKARGIYKAVLQQVRYDKSVPGWGRGDTRRVCLLGTGNCTDFHSLFISMARASRIPARFKIGVVIPKEASGAIPGYHCWAEFYEERRGWVPVDASEAWKHPELADYYFGAHDANRLLISMGRDIQLAPPQQGDPVNIFFYPYVEVDGQAFDDVETELSFRELNEEEAI
jgi:transglutaminase-like putative cysteine protease